MTQKTIYTVSASDRNNYGDLLFSHMLEYAGDVLKADVKFIHTSTTPADLSEFGALPVIGHEEFVRSLKAAHDEHQSTQIIYAGGEALGTPWFTLLSFVNRHADYAYRSPVLRRIVRKTKVIQRYYRFRYDTLYPFIPSEWESTAIPFTYNSIGVSALRVILQHDKRLIERLARAKYLGVRDARSSRILVEFGIPHEVVPCSALLMNEKYAPDLAAHTVPIDNVDRSIVVQITPEKGPKDLERFANVLTRVAETTSSAIILLPIGLARRHDDEIALRRLQNYLPASLFYKPIHLLDIMKVISSCRLFIGTSLHGAITAQSFQRPFVGLSERVPKLKSYLNTWGKSELVCENYDDLSASIQRALIFKYDIQEEHAQRQMLWSALENQLRD